METPEEAIKLPFDGHLQNPMNGHMYTTKEEVVVETASIA